MGGGAMSDVLDPVNVLDFVEAIKSIARQSADKKGKPKAKLPADEFLKHGSDVEIADAFAASSAMQNVVFDEGRFWRHDGRCWAPIPDDEIYRAIKKYDGKTYGGGQPVRLSDARIESIFRTVSKTLARLGFFTEATRGINAANGLIVFGDDFEPRLIAHDPDHRKRHVLAGSWEHGSLFDPPEGSLLARYLAGLRAGDPEGHIKERTLRQIAGVVVMGHGTRLIDPKSAVLLGRTAENGKTQYLNMITNLLPPAAVCTVPPDRLHDDNKMMLIVGALLNISGELSGAIASERFKSVITGDKLDARKAYGRDVAQFYPEAQHVFATNQLPPFRGGMDAGVRRRLLVVEFLRTIPPGERIYDIGRRIAREEPDLLLAWAIEGARDLLKNGNRFAEPLSSARILDEWTQTADPVMGWKADRVAPPLEAVNSEKPRISNADAFRDFQRWHEDVEGKKATIGQRTFTERLRSAGLPGVSYVAKHGFRGWEGLRLKKRGEDDSDFLNPAAARTGPRD